MAAAATARIQPKKQTLDDAYAPPANFLEIDIVHPETHGVGKKRYTDYEIRMKVSRQTGRKTGLRPSSLSLSSHLYADIKHFPNVHLCSAVVSSLSLTRSDLIVSHVPKVRNSTIDLLCNLWMKWRKQNFHPLSNRFVFRRICPFSKWRSRAFVDDTVTLTGYPQNSNETARSRYNSL